MASRDRYFRSTVLGTVDGEPADIDITVVLPCFNEADHVVQELDKITQALDASKYSYELLVIDDKSTDNTLEVLTAALPNYPQMRLMPFQRNGGSGTARRIGSREGRGEFIVWTDADLTYQNDRIPDLVGFLETFPEYDQVVGSRTSEQGTYKFLRVPAKWVIRKIAERLSGSKIPDLNSGLRAFRKSVALPYLRLLPPGFSCVTTITLAFLMNQHAVGFIDTEYYKRAGKSKFAFISDAYRYILQVLRMIMYFNPLKVLMPLALSLLGLGVVKTVVDLIRYKLHLTTSSVLLLLTGLLIGSVALLADLIVRSRDDS